MTSCDNYPHEVGQDIPVLVLATAVITVQVDLLLPQIIVLEVGVEIGYDGIGTLAATVALIHEVVDLPGVHLLGIVKKLRCTAKSVEQGGWGPRGGQPAAV